MALHATILYAGIFGLIYVYLSIQVTLLRAKYQVWFGDGKRRDLLKAIRIHGNFAEFVPFTLFLLYISELVGGRSWILHTLGAIFLISRILLILALRKDGPSPERLVGILLTWAVILILSAFCLVSAF
jgi:uncharacterized membrane protein YecN with MAPEG domain